MPTQNLYISILHGHINGTRYGGRPGRWDGRHLELDWYDNRPVQFFTHSKRRWL